LNYLDLFSPGKLKEYLFEHDMMPKKSLGQNFLIDKNSVERIVEVMGIKKEDEVVEVGAGLGVLTKPIAEHAKKVHAYEIDERVTPVLEEITKGCDNLTIHNKDILTEKTFPQKYKLVGNLPFYITSRIMRHVLSQKNKPETITFVMQKEVATRICEHGNKSSKLSISIQIYGEPKIVLSLSKNAFWPKPDVDTVVLQVKLFKKPLITIEQEPLFFTILGAGFAQKRKTLLNNLQNITLPRGKIVTREEWEVMLKKINIDPNTRAEALTIEEWVTILTFL
jgi:16S rRNA (adenine1518-N6/adenine1519-N6)-dimethyltransferase